jgi:hypothetical protein
MAGNERGGRGRFIDLTGQTFGKLVVLRRLDPAEVRARGKKTTSAHWLCRCACGSKKPVAARSLVVGMTRSCGQSSCRWRS